MRLAGRRGAVSAVVAIACALAAAAPAAAQGPSVDAEAWLLADAATGSVIVSRKPQERRPIASATKLMTALLALEGARPREVFRATGYDPAPVESQIGLEPGERMAVRDLLVALLLESANDAAAALAVGVAGSEREFVGAMNDRANRLGLEDTSYANPTGFDAPGNYSTAADLAELARRLMESARFRDIVEEPRLRLRTGDRPRVVENRNELVGSAPHVDGIKTGHTLGAGYVLVGSAEEDGARVVSVVLGAPSAAARDAATRRLLAYGLDRFVDRRVLRDERVVARAEVEGRDGERVALAPVRSVFLTLLPHERVERRVEAPAKLQGPLPAGERVGSVAVIRSGEVVKRVPLVTVAAVPAPGGLGETLAAFGDDPVALTLAVALLAAIAALGVIGVRRLRARTRDRAVA